MKVQKLNADAMLTRATSQSAGLDLHTSEDITIKACARVLVPTGIAVSIPIGYVGDLHIRSSMSLKKGLCLMNGVGVIDADYRGEIKVLLWNTTEHPVSIDKGDRIAQLVIKPILIPEIEFVDSLDETDRGNNGFGSTGK